MRRTWALLSILLLTLSAPISTAGLLTMSLSSTNETVNQHNGISAVPYDQTPSPSSTPYTAPSDSITLESLNAYQSLSLPENLTVGTPWHIPGTLINLTFTAFGGRLIFTTAYEMVNEAIDNIYLNVVLHPADTITDGIFQQRHGGLSLRVHQYVYQHMTWSLLNQLFLGLQNYFMTQPQRLRDMAFEIDVEDVGRVGYGSLWSTGLSEGSDAAKRDVNETSQSLRMLSISKPAPTKLNQSLLLPVPSESRITFSYHFYGPVVPESLIDACFDLARQSIRAHVQTHPDDELPGGSFQYQPDGSDYSVEIHAYGRNEISWLLLDDLLRQIHADLIDERHLSACEIEFAIAPVEEPYGYASLMYDPPDILPANRSQITASGVRKTSRRLRNAKDTSKSPQDAIIAIPNPALE